MANRCRSETGGAMTEAGVDAVLSGLASALPEGFLRVERSGGSWTLRFGRADRTDPPAALWMEDGGEIGWPHVPDPARWWLATCAACLAIRAAAPDDGYVDEADDERSPADFDLRYPTFRDYQEDARRPALLRYLDRALRDRALDHVRVPGSLPAPSP